jgi:hypothetical protein
MKDVQETLDTLFPEPARMSDWDAVLRDARPRRRSPVLQLAIATGVAALAALFLVAPWKGAERVGILDRALAAVGDEPVLHVVFRGDWGGMLVDLKTGDRKPLYGEREVWFDPDRGLVHHVSRFGGGVEHEEVYKRNKKDRELTVLWQDYRQALEQGTARVVGEDVVDGVPVYWIIVRSLVRPDVADDKDHELAQQVAVSRETFKPVAMKYTRDRQPTREIERILLFETVPLDEADFKSESGASVSGRPMRSCSTPTKLGNASEILGRAPLWLGPEYEGLPLAQTRKDSLAIGQSRDGSGYKGGRPDYGREHTGVVFFYGTLGDDPSTSGSYTMPLLTERYVEIAQTTDRELLTPGAPMKYVPPKGSIVVGPGVSGYFVRDGVYITIRGADDKLILDAARALRPMPSAGSGAGG